MRRQENSAPEWCSHTLPPPSSRRSRRKNAGSPIDTIVSLEGNLTADDAYFSGTAADFDEAHEFRTAFLARLTELARTDANIERYRNAVESAEAQALWELGVDVRIFSAAQRPGDVLCRTPKVAYFYNPDNLSAASLSWLAKRSLKPVCLPGASHWICRDEPEALADVIIEALAAH